jgi:hypothetical protein
MRTGNCDVQKEIDALIDDVCWLNFSNDEPERNLRNNPRIHGHFFSSIEERVLSVCTVLVQGYCIAITRYDTK